MIDFTLDEELELLRDTARQLAVEQLRPAEREAEHERRPPAAVREAFAKIGLAGLELPERLGGAGLGALARALVNEELAAGDPGAALALDPLGPALYPLAELGGEAALERWAVPLVERSDARAVLVWNGEHAIVTEAGRARGRVPWVPAERVDLLVVLDRDSAFVVREGIRLEPVRGAGLRAAGAAELLLEDGPVAAFWVDPAAARRALARARLYVAGLLVGVLRAASEYARAYARERVAFGRPIAHHQALAFLLMDMHCAVEGARTLLWDAALRLDAGEDALAACSAAFVEAAEQASFVGPNAVQVLGGHGFMQDYPVEKWMREARVLGLWLGGIDAAREDAACALEASEHPLDLLEAQG